MDNNYTLTVRMDKKIRDEMQERLGEAHVRIKGNRFLSWIPQTREKSKLYFTDTRIKYQE